MRSPPGVLGPNLLQKAGSAPAFQSGKSGCEDLAAFHSAAGEHLPAVLCGHALAETMFLLALPFFRLICSDHFSIPLLSVFQACRSDFLADFAL
jgi:hypothetical protein